MPFNINEFGSEKPIISNAWPFQQTNKKTIDFFRLRSLHTIPTAHDVMSRESLSFSREKRDPVYKI